MTEHNIYYAPEAYGLELVGEISWDSDPYQFDLTVVWRDSGTGKLYIGSDAGCSCPDPFEYCSSIRELEEVTAAGAIRQIEGWRRHLDNSQRDGLESSLELIKKLRRI